MLELVGVARALREQALPLLFRIKPPVPPVALGQAVKVVEFNGAQVTVDGGVGAGRIPPHAVPGLA